MIDLNLIDFYDIFVIRGNNEFENENFILWKVNLIQEIHVMINELVDFFIKLIIKF